ncbi:hypothetical protein CR513_42448, partial [Mucuna pruriens]
MSRHRGSLVCNARSARGRCGSHIGGRTLASKIAKASYYWPTLKSNCSQFVKKYIRKAPPEPLHLVMSPWPFHKLEADILGPFPIAADNSTGRD